MVPSPANITIVQNNITVVQNNITVVQNKAQLEGIRQLCNCIQSAGNFSFDGLNMMILENLSLDHVSCSCFQAVTVL